jgi:monofunctional biosynthetic peptidoglycan transglycosylase
MRYRMEEASAAGETLVIQQRWVPLSQISPQMVRAVIASEDGRFRDHAGIDWEALGEELHYRGKPPFSWSDPDDRRALLAAARYYLDHRDRVKGRSTITQQLAKNLYFSPTRSLARKAAEFFVAQRLERFLSKDRILEIYLNTVELGPGLFGVEAAAQKYFRVPASKLTQFQAASLAGTLPQPLKSNPGYRPSQMAWRRELILARLRGGGTDLSPIPETPEDLAPPEPAAGENPAGEPAAAPDASAPEPPGAAPSPETGEPTSTSQEPTQAAAPDSL